MNWELASSSSPDIFRLYFEDIYFENLLKVGCLPLNTWRQPSRKMGVVIGAQFSNLTIFQVYKIWGKALYEPDCYFILHMYRICIYNYSVLYSVLAIGLNSLKPGLPLGPPRRPRHPPLHPRVWGVQVLQVPQN